MAGGQHESVAVNPFGIGWRVLQKLRPKRIGSRRESHRGARMPAVYTLNRVNREEANRVYRLPRDTVAGTDGI